MDGTVDLVVHNPGGKGFDVLPRIFDAFEERCRISVMLVPKASKLEITLRPAEIHPCGESVVVRRVLFGPFSQKRFHDEPNVFGVDMRRRSFAEP